MISTLFNWVALTTCVYINHSGQIKQHKSFFFHDSLSLSLWRGTSPGETKLLASEIYEILQSAGKEEAEQAEAAAASCQRKAHFFLGSNNKRAKTVVLHIDGLDDPVSAFRIHQTSVDAQKSLFGASCLLLSLSRCCQCSLAVSIWHRIGGLEGSGCKCQPLNSGTLRLNLNAALQEACT